MQFLVGGDRPHGFEAAGVAVELAHPQTGENGAVTLARLQVLGGDFLVGVGLELEVHAPTGRFGFVVLHDVIHITAGTDDIEYAEAAFGVGGLGGHGGQAHRCYRRHR